MRIPRTVLLLALAVSRAHAAHDAAAAGDGIAPKQRGLLPEDEAAALEAARGGSGLLGYIYCVVADWSAWLRGCRSEIHREDRPRREERRRRLEWGSTSGMRYATRSSQSMHK